MVLGKDNFDYHFKPSSVLSAASTCHACYLEPATRKIIMGSSRSLKIRVGVFPSSLIPTLGISGRDSCKGVEL